MRFRRAACGGLLAALSAGSVRAADWRIGAGAFYGQSDTSNAPSQGFGEIATEALSVERSIGRHLSARFELSPVILIRERERLSPTSPSGQTSVIASGATLLARYHLRKAPNESLFLEGGYGPFYAYRLPVPRGGTRANFLDQLGVGMSFSNGAGTRWDFSVRVSHVSNGNLGPRGSNGNPGITFLTAGIAWSIPWPATTRRRQSAPSISGVRDAGRAS